MNMLSICLFLAPTVVDESTYFLDHAVGFSLTLLVFRFAKLLHVEKSKDAVVAVLPGEEAARAVEALFGPKQGILANAAVRDEKTGRLIVLATGQRRRVPAQSDEADRLGERAMDGRQKEGNRIAGVETEGPNRVEDVELGVQRIAAILGREQRLFVGEREIVEGIVLRVAEYEDRNPAFRL